MTTVPCVRIRSQACSACPYRCDVPAGVWSEEDYAKLPPYDVETFDQPTAGFACHATPDHLCHGWAVVGGHDLLALRLASLGGPGLQIPTPSTDLWETHTQAAEHGLSGVAEPGAEAVEVGQRLIRKYERLR